MPDLLRESEKHAPLGVVSVREVLALQFDRDRDLLVHSADRAIQVRSPSNLKAERASWNAHENIIWYFILMGTD